MRDPYLVLGIPRDSTEDDVKQAFRKLAMQYHPDRNPNNPEAEAKFKELVAAYDEIKNPKPQQPHFQDHDGPFGFEFRTGPGGFNFEDFFNVFHGHRQQGQRQPKNPDVSVQYTISLLDAFHGKEVELSIRTPSGTKTISLSIPAGIETGMRLRVAGAGERMYTNLPPGDIFVTIFVQPDATFERLAQNLLYTTEIDAFDAMLGVDLSIVTIDGSTVSVTIPPTTQHGTRLRVAGHGMPVTGSPHRGDLIVIVAVRVPQVTKEQEDLLRQAKLLKRA